MIKWATSKGRGKRRGWEGRGIGGKER